MRLETDANDLHLHRLCEPAATSSLVYLSKMCLLLNIASFGRVRESFSIISILHGMFLSRAIIISGSEFHLSQKLKFCQLFMSFLHTLNASKVLPYFLFLFLFLISLTGWEIPGVFWSSFCQQLNNLGMLSFCAQAIHIDERLSWPVLRLQSGLHPWLERMPLVLQLSVW